MQRQAKNLVEKTNSFRSATLKIQMMMVSSSAIELFCRAVEMKKAGFTYAEWENESGAGSTAKKIAKEIFLLLEAE